MLSHSLKTLTRQAVRAGSRSLVKALKVPAAKRLRPAKAAKTAKPGPAGRSAAPGKPASAARAAKPQPASGAGTWTSGVAMGPVSPAGARRYALYRPPGVQRGESLPLLVMLHGCGQDAKSFALGTRMNAVAARERFLVLYPEQDRLANAQGCWNWFDTRSGRAEAEAASILRAIDQVCRLQPADRARVVVAGLSAGASMAALLATLHPDRFKAVVMHSGVPPGRANSALSALRAMHGRRAGRLPGGVAGGVAGVTPAGVAGGAAGGIAASWPPLLVIHGVVDPVVAISNGRDAAQAWAAAAGAVAGPPRKVQRGQRYPLTVTDFKRGRHTVATLAAVDRLGHAWSGGAAGQPYSDAKGPDASRLVWAFAARQLRV